VQEHSIPRLLRTRISTHSNTAILAMALRSSRHKRPLSSLSRMWSLEMIETRGNQGRLPSSSKDVGRMPKLKIDYVIYSVHPICFGDGIMNLVTSDAVGVLLRFRTVHCRCTMSLTTSAL
jgi:hypothetical protein